MPPYKWANCSTTSFRSDATAEHSSPYLPQWGPMEKLYTAMGGQRSYLKASTGPIRTAADGRGTLRHLPGRQDLVDTSSTPAVAHDDLRQRPLRRSTAVPRALGYPKAARVSGLRDGGWIHVFEKGCIVDSASTHDAPGACRAIRVDPWVAAGSRERRPRLPGGARRGPAAGGWIQRFQQRLHRRQHRHDHAHRARAPPGPAWQQVGRETGVLGFPTTEQAGRRGRHHAALPGWRIWGRSGRPAWAVRGAVLTRGRRRAAPAGGYGFPTAHVVDNGDGTQTGAFEGGTITA